MNNLFNKIAQWAKFNEPKILLTTSIISNASSVVTAAIAGSKTPAVIRRHNERVSTIHANMENGAIEVNEGKKLLRRIYISTGAKLLKLYSAPILLYTAGTLCSIRENKIMSNRVAQMATYAAGLEKIIEQYKDRDEKTKQLLEDKPEEIKSLPEVFDNKKFVLVFDESNPMYENHPGINMSRLLIEEQQINYRLKSNGYVFVSDLLKILGYTIDNLDEETLARARVMGWVYDPSDPNLKNYISFNIADPLGNVFSNVMENNIRSNNPKYVIELNTDGNIYLDKNGKPIWTKYIKMRY